jgi:ribosome-associated protein
MTDVIPLIDISVQPIELCKLLKIANMVGGGGEAKIVISEGYVVLNNEVEFQKRKKVYHDDIVDFNGETIQVNYVKASKNKNTKTNQTKEALVKEEKNSKTQKAKAINKTQNNTNVKPKTAEPTEVIRAKRKPISF